MKILKKMQNTSPAWSLQEYCTGVGNGKKGCGSKLEIHQEDLYRTYSSTMGRFEVYYVTFMCPVCGEETDLWNSDLPDRNYYGPKYQQLPFPSSEKRHLAKKRLQDDLPYLPPHMLK